MKRPTVLVLNIVLYEGTLRQFANQFLHVSTPSRMIFIPSEGRVVKSTEFCKGSATFSSTMYLELPLFASTPGIIDVNGLFFFLITLYILLGSFFSNNQISCHNIDLGTRNQISFSFGYF